MKNLILLLIGVLFGLQVFAQQDTIHPVSMSATAKTQFLTALDLNDVSKVRDFESPVSLMDSIKSLLRFRTITVSDTLELTDLGKTLLINSETTVTITIPLNATVPFPYSATTGASLHLVQKGIGDVNIVIISGGTLESSLSMTSIGGQHQAATLFKTAENSWTMVGGLK